MNKVNWIDGRYTTPNDFNAMQTEPEAHIEALGRRLPADVDGCVPAGAAAGVTIGAGVAWDAAGRRIVIPVGGAAVDMTGIDRPAANQYRWLTWFAAYQRISRGTMRDKMGGDQPAYLDDGFSLGVRAGAAFAETSIDRARALQVATRPAAPAGAVVLGYSILDHQSTYQTLFTADTLFRNGVRLLSPPAVIVAQAASYAGDALDQLAATLPRPRDYAIGAGSLWSDGKVYPLFLAHRTTDGNIQSYFHFARSVQPVRGTSNVSIHAVFDRVVSYGPADFPWPATGGW